MPSHRLELTYRSSWFTFGLISGRFFPRFFLRWFATWMGYLYAFCNPTKSKSLTDALDVLEADPKPTAGKVFASFARVLTDYLSSDQDRFHMLAA